MKTLQQQTTYEVAASCDNCLWVGTAIISYGSPVAQKPCPQCGCAKLKAVPKVTWTVNVTKPW